MSTRGNASILAASWSRVSIMLKILIGFHPNRGQPNHPQSVVPHLLP